MTLSSSLAAGGRATLFFEPLDVLHFRDHRPFDAGWHTHARSVFPLPTVFLGCLRTALLVRAGGRFDRPDFGLQEAWARELLGTQDAPGTLHLKGPFLAKYGRASSGASLALFLPRPRDLHLLQDAPEPGRGVIARALMPSARRYRGAQASPASEVVAWSQSGASKSTPPLLSIAGAHEYCEGRAPDGAHFVEESCFYAREPRVGLVRSEEHLTAEDHLLYATQPFRFLEDVGLAIEIELPAAEQARAAIASLHHAIVPLGGKGHHARIHVVASELLPAEEPTKPSAEPPGASGRFYKLWLVTPLVIGSGRWPSEVSCLAAERAIPVGGFDLAKRAPKPLRQALPAGTVLRVQDLPPEVALQRLAGADDPSCLSQWNHDRRAGFGVALVAKEAG